MLKEVSIKVAALKNHSGFRRYAANTSWMMGEKILRLFVGLFVGIWVARYLGPGKFGLFSYTQSFVFLFTAFATLGLDGIVVRELVKDGSQRDKILGTAFGLKLLGALSIMPMLWSAVRLADNDNYTNLLVFVVALATIFQSFNVIDFYYQATVQSKYVAWVNSLSLGLSSLIKIALILNEAPLIAFAIMVVVDAIVLASGLLFFYINLSGHKVSRWSFEINTAKKLLKDSWPLILSGLMVSVYMKVDQVMIKEMLGAEAVGQYSAAVRLSEAWYFIPMVIANSLFPAILGAKKINEELYLRRLQRLYTLMVWLAIAIAVPMTFLSDWLVTLLYGVDYQEAAAVLVVHIWAGAFVFLGVASGKWLIAEGMTVIAMRRVLAGVAINVALNMLLIPRYGVIGAAVAVLISQFFAAFLYDLIDPKTRFQFFIKARAFWAGL